MKKTFSFVVLGAVMISAAIYFTDFGNWLRSSILQNQPEYVTLHTNHGNIKIKLYLKEAPKLTENFLCLTKNKKYNDTIFHRVIEGFMIQGGDFTNFDGTGGESCQGGLLEDEFSPTLSHIRGAVSMANRGPNTNGSQFCIVQKDAAFLDGRHSIIGHVVEGMSVVDNIADEKTDASDRPFEPVKIERTIIQ